VRFRQPPFDSQHLQAKLAGTEPPQPIHHGVAAPRPGRIKKLLAGGGLAGFIGGLVGLACAIIPGPREIAPIAPGSLGASTWSAATLERGRQIALAGDCAVCHTAPGGQKNAGGFALETPFGTIYSTNITPDVETGIGVWSYPAFERAMRKGIHRDGKHLYPAFPYPHFAKASDADLQALYAYLMAQAPVRADAPNNELRFPFNLRPLMAGWNALFHQAETFQPNPARSEAWNRGAYLVEGLGHCSACHSPRNALGAEQRQAYLAGGFAEGWEAPPLTSLSHAPIPWSEDELFAYLRTGHSRYHGVAAGPMAPIVRDLKALPDRDIRAMAVYLGSFNDTAADAPALAARLESATQVAVASSTGARLYQGACAVCHEVGGLPLFGSRPSLALNSNLHSATSDNLVQVILHGIAEPASSDLGYMPAFKSSMSDAQVEELVSFLRQQFAPDKPAWTGVRETIARVRSSTH
jgi:nicotinate dehydrogenase subunit B